MAMTPSRMAVVSRSSRMSGSPVAFSAGMASAPVVKTVQEACRLRADLRALGLAPGRERAILHLQAPVVAQHGRIADQEGPVEEVERAGGRAGPHLDVVGAAPAEVGHAVDIGARRRIG